MKQYDIAFIGHMCFDELIPFGGQAATTPGSAVLCGAMAAARIGRRVLVITRMAAADAAILEPMKAAGIDVHMVPVQDTSLIRVYHPSENVDERVLTLKKNAGFFQIEDVPPISATCVHLAGISSREFTLDFMKGLHARGYNLSVDMQSFVRQADPKTGEVTFGDEPSKRDIVKLMRKVKLDIVEAQQLTGTTDLEKAAIQFEQWGCPETVITQAEGVLARRNGQTFYEKFSNRSVIGRTGRGDTTFAGYLAWRMEHEVEESLRFAAALVSIKMETPGPYRGTLQDVLARMKQCHSGK